MQPPLRPRPCFLLAVFSISGLLGTFADAARSLPVPYWHQPDGSTCMPTSLLMCLAYFGKDELSDERIYELHRRTRVNRLNIPAILREYGLDGDASYSPYWTFDDIRADIDDGLPVILGTDLSDAGHIMVAVGYTDDGRVLVNDPGYRREGHVPVTLDEIKFDGGGVRFRRVPPGPWQAEWVAQHGNGWMNEGERRELWIEYRNRGTKTWPAGEVELRPSAPPDPPGLFYDPPTWISPRRIARITRDVPPGETYRFRFFIVAPAVEYPTPFSVPVHLACRNEWFGYPRDRDVGIGGRVWPRFSLPIEDRFPPSGPSLPWVSRFTSPQPVRRRDDPMGDGVVLRIQDRKNGGYESIRIGNLGRGDYRASALLFCSYRPAITNGFERIGLFVRDNYRGDFEKKRKGKGYMILHDSSDGRIRCAKVVYGTIHDFLVEPIFLRGSAWHEFAVECRGTRIRFFLDGKEIAAVDDDFRREGLAGIGYHEYFEDDSLAEGALAARFRLDPVE